MSDIDPATYRRSPESILNEIATSYTSRTRAVSTAGDMCVYLSSKGCRCALGRFFLDDVPPSILDLSQNATGLIRRLRKLQDLDPAPTRITEPNPLLDSILRPEVRGYPVRFWLACQNLHDHREYWELTGLSQLGRERYNSLLGEFTHMEPSLS